MGPLPPPQQGLPRSYDPKPEAFLYFVSRLLSTNPHATDLKMLLKPLLKERIRELIRTNGDALQIAMRILTCEYVGIRGEVDLPALLRLQCEDRSYTSWVYRFGSTGILIGNKGLTTAMAVKAVEVLRQSASVEMRCEAAKKGEELRTNAQYPGASLLLLVRRSLGWFWSFKLKYTGSTFDNGAIIL